MEAWVIAIGDKKTSGRYIGPPNMALLEIGEVFNGRYDVVRCIKVGGMGAVYEVFHLQTKKKRALKVMLPAVVQQQGMRSRFKVEATIVAAVESDHIADVVDAGVDEVSGSPFIVMELLRGEELGAMLERLGKLPAEDVVLYLSHAAYGLDRTHAEGIVHRDLKPENLFVTYRDDGSPRLKLLDFGIAKVLGETGHNTRGIVGTPLFISPEQVHGERPISPRTDVYALAHIAYNLLTGEPYWKQEESAAETVMPFLVKVMKGHVQPATERALQRRGVTLPPAFDAWFDRATAVDPDARHAGALAMVTELAAVFGLTVKPGQRVSEVPPAAAPSCEPTRKEPTSAGSDPQPRAASAPPAAPAHSPTAGAVTRTFAIEAKTSKVARAFILTTVALTAAVIGLVFLIRKEPGSEAKGAAASGERTATSASVPAIAESSGDTGPARENVAEPGPPVSASAAPATAPAPASVPRVTPTVQPTAEQSSSVPAPKAAPPPAPLPPRPPASSSTTSPEPSATGWRPPVSER